MDKINLLDMTLEQMEVFFQSIGEPKFRARQVFRWIHVSLITDFALMTDVAKSLQAKLQQTCCIKLPEIFSENVANDGVVKWLLKVDALNKIETVFIPEENRGTLCVSSQVGCALECQFCSTGRQGFNRNLSTAEIIAQLWIALTRLKKSYNCEKIVTNIVFMGMGEPLANYNSVLNAIKIMLDNNAYNLSKRKVTVSTSGVLPGINKLKDDCPVSLAISLHASNNMVRNQIIPLNQKYPIEQLINTCKDYIKYSHKKHITFEYVMLKGVNDNLNYAQELISLVDNLPCKFNLIPFNPFPNSGYESSSRNQIVKFQKMLQDAGLVTTIRKTRGDSIDAACGQLVGNVKDKTKRQEKWGILKIV